MDAKRSVVRDHSTAYYGKIETAISLLRSSIETEPTDFTNIQSSYDDLKNGIDAFVKGEAISSASTDLTLNVWDQAFGEGTNQFSIRRR